MQLIKEILRCPFGSEATATALEQNRQGPPQKEQMSRFTTE
jgi:hypothetical protein